MSEAKHLFLIVMPQPVPPKLAEKTGNLKEELRNAPSIRLYNLKQIKKKDRPLALSLPSGRVIILRKINNKNCFLYITALDLPRPPASTKYRLELSGDVEGLILEDKDVTPYLSHAVDCSTIEQDVESKQVWDPQEGSDPEFKKWKVYIDLYKNMIEKQRFGLDASVDKSNSKTIQVTVDLAEMLDDDSAEIIKKAEGERISFSFLPPGSIVSDNERRGDVLGDLKSFNAKENRMGIELSDDFRGFRAAVEQKRFYVIEERLPNDEESKSNEISGHMDSKAAPDEAIQLKFVSKELLTASKRKIFYYDQDRKKPAFSCLAECDASGEWIVASDSIEPKKMMLFADFFSEMSQLKIVERGLKEIISRDIWQVLSRERVSKLPCPKDDIDWADSRLNPDQRDAVKKAVEAQELCLIWGPPGTGKTEVIMEIAKQECLHGHKTLIASQANLAVDNALARLHGSDKVWPFRIAKGGYELEHEDQIKVPMGNTAGLFFAKRLCDSIKKRMQEDGGDDVASNLRQKLVNQLEKEVVSDKARLSRTIPQMAGLYRRRINVVGATLMGTGKTQGKGKERKNQILSTTGIPKFDTVIVDEVSKALPTELFLPILLGGKVVLVGDHKQLPPMLKVDSGDSLSLEKWSHDAGVEIGKEDLEKTLFEMLWEKHTGDAAKVRQMLTTQYRMHPDIERIIQPFYEDSEGTLECGLTTDQQSKMRISHSGTWARGHAFWVDTDIDSNVIEVQDGTSRYNLQEIEIIGKILEKLPSKDLDGNDLSVGVISFYGAQLQRLRERHQSKYSEKFPDGRLIFGTVDRFQGRENDIVICSLVRKNNNRNIGFATKPNRINVAFSRARRLLCIVGSRGMFCYEESKEEATAIYRGVYGKCHPLSRNNIVE